MNQDDHSAQTNQCLHSSDECRRIGPKGHPEACWQCVERQLRDLFKTANDSGAYPVMLMGEPGRGKSYAMAALFRIVTGQPIWWSAVEFVRTIQVCRRDGSVLLPGSSYETSESAIWSVRVERPSCLFIDDLGIRQPSPSAYETLFELFDRRGTSPMFISTNLDPADMESVYGPRLSSRLMRGTVITVEGEDRRWDHSRAHRVKI